MRGFGFRVWPGANVLDLSIYFSQPDKFFLWLPNLLFKIYNKSTLSQTVFSEFCFLLTKSNEGRQGEGGRREGGGGPEPPSTYAHKIFTRQRITLVKINGAELKLKGRTMNIK